MIQSKLDISNRKEAMDVIRGIRKENGGKLTGMTLKSLISVARRIHRLKQKKYKNNTDKVDKERDVQEKGEDEEIEDSEDDWKECSEDEVSLKESEEQDSGDEESDSLKDKQRRDAKTCNFCFKFFSRKQARDIHVDLFHRQKASAIECKICESKFKLKTSLDKHMKEKHCSEDKFYCSQCDKRYSYQKDLLERSHKEETLKTNSCDLCKKMFSRKSNLYQHRKRVHMRHNINFDKAREELRIENGVFKCRICELEFKSMDKLNSHLISNTCIDNRNLDENFLYKCDLCEKAFLNKNTLQSHVKFKHSKQLKHVCSECKATFSYKSTLKRHIKDKHN